MPIIESLLDNDFYQFTMGQVIRRYFCGEAVTYALPSRPVSPKLADYIDYGELRAEIEHARSLRFHPAEIEFLRETGFFSENYLTFLQAFQLPPVDLTVDDQLRATVTGPWEYGVFWETPLTAITQELYCRELIKRSGFNRDGVIQEGLTRLTTKIELLNQYPDLQFLEFGSRRRFSTAWQREVVRTLSERLRYGQMVGTSNVKLAFDLGLQPGGTMAHQLFMVASALAVGAGIPDPLVVAQNRVLHAWEDLYAEPSGGKLLIALPDTYGTPFFLRHFSKERAERWAGLRQDSGVPVDEVAQFIAYYRRMGIDPMSKLALPSDGLSAKDMTVLFDQFRGIIPTPFGVGTDWTNDLGIRALPLVMKPIRANGHPVVKLSNTLTKATGDPDAIQQYIELAHYREPTPETATTTNNC